MKYMISATLLLSALLVLATAAAEETGFLPDYSNLIDTDGDFINRAYVAPGAMDRLANYDSVMVDEPEVFISEDTRYRGAKADQLKQLADTVRLTMMERLEAGGYAMADEAGPSVIYMRWAITNLFLRKKKRGILSFTPLGAVVHATRQAAVRDLWKKIDIVEIGVEIEFLDSVSGEQLAAVVVLRGARETDEQERELVSWEELDALMQTLGERVRCNLDNSKLEVADRQDCAQIVIEPVIEES